MHTRLKPAEIRWLTPTVGTLPSGLQTTLLLTAGLALRVGRQRGAAEERQSCVNTERCPTATTLRSSERTSSQLAEPSLDRISTLLQWGSLPSSVSLQLPSRSLSKAVSGLSASSSSPQPPCSSHPWRPRYHHHLLRPLACVSSFPHVPLTPFGQISGLRSHAL